MTLLFRVLFAYKCQGTHHKLAMDALRHLKHADADLWQDLFLSQIEPYLTGSKDPDKKFKDFKNHVLHVSDNYWGGAPQTGRLWYERALLAFRNQEWQKGVYATGVLSHYITDPVMPLHTGQTDREAAVHRPCEWSVSQSYDDLNPAELPERAAHSISPEDPQWLEQLIVQGAEYAHLEYNQIIEQYDLDRGVKVPLEGLNEQLQITFRRLLRQAMLNVAFAIDQLIVQAEVTPPRSGQTVETVLASLSIPVFWVTRKLADHKERKLVTAIYNELKTTGKVEKSLPEDERTVRDLHRVEVLRLPADGSSEGSPPPSSPVATETSPNPTTQHRAARNLRFYLRLEDDVVDAPSIGPKTARRLNGIGIHTVADLLAFDPAAAVEALNLRYITVELFIVWQQQSRLMSAVPTLRGHDAQILVGCDIVAAETLANMSADELWQRAVQFTSSEAAQKLMRNPQPPELEEVRQWIAAAASVGSQTHAA